MIQVGDKLPDAHGFVMGASGPEQIGTDRLFEGKRVVVIGVPAAYSGTCSFSHLPSYLNHSESLRNHGVESVICLSVNDAFVMDAWGKQLAVEGRIIMFGDSEASLTKKLGLEIDLSVIGLGIRSKRYTMFVSNRRVDYLAVEPDSTKFDKTKVEALLEHLKEKV